MNERLIHESTWITTIRAFEVIENLIPEVEKLRVFQEMYLRIGVGMRGYEEEAVRVHHSYIREGTNDVSIFAIDADC
jgi:hypothetical protein